jgi:hypothetical protein
MMPGEPMPDFAVPGADLTRAELTGRPTLIGFFSTSCKHCPAQAERLGERADEIAGSGTTLISVLNTAEGDDTLSPALRKAGRLISETGPGGLASAFHAEATPTFLLFDEAGVLRAVGHGLDEVLAGR